MSDPLVEPIVEQTQASGPDPVTATTSSQEALALEIVKRHVMYAAVIGLVPVPLVNLAGVIGVELKLMKDLATLYGVPFKQDRVKSIASALVGGTLSTEVGLGTAGLVKGTPLIGAALSAAALPAIAGAITYAIGKVFIQHFESGGTFLDFEPSKVKHHFKDLFQTRKAAVA